MIRNDIKYQFRSNFSSIIRRDNIFLCFCCNSYINRIIIVVELLEGNEFIKRTFQLSDVRFDVGCNIVQYIILNVIFFQMIQFNLLL